MDRAATGHDHRDVETPLVVAGPPGSEAGWVGFPYEETRAGTRAEFERTLARFDWRGVAHEAEFVDGEPAEVLLERAQAADLAVIGMRGHGRLASVLLGSVAYALLKHSTKPSVRAG